MSCAINACFAFVSQACLRAIRVRVGQHPRAHPKDADMEKEMLLHDVTTEVLVK